MTKIIQQSQRFDGSTTPSRKIDLVGMQNTDGTIYSYEVRVYIPNPKPGHELEFYGVRWGIFWDIDEALKYYRFAQQHPTWPPAN